MADKDVEVSIVTNGDAISEKGELAMEKSEDGSLVFKNEAGLELVSFSSIKTEAQGFIDTILRQLSARSVFFSPEDERSNDEKELVKRIEEKFAYIALKKVKELKPSKLVDFTVYANEFVESVGGEENLAKILNDSGCLIRTVKSEYFEEEWSHPSITVSAPYKMKNGSDKARPYYAEIDKSIADEIRAKYPKIAAKFADDDSESIKEAEDAANNGKAEV